MKQIKALDIALWIFLVIGLLGALKISYANFTGQACPKMWIVPICYLVFLAYALMLGSVIVRHNGCKHYFFAIGWSIAFVFALLGSAAEWLGGGGVCPSSSSGGVRGASAGGIPMCYISLALTVIILVLFLIGPYKRVCDACNANK